MVVRSKDPSYGKQNCISPFSEEYYVFFLFHNMHLLGTKKSTSVGTSSGIALLGNGTGSRAKLRAKAERRQEVDDKPRRRRARRTTEGRGMLILASMYCIRRIMLLFSIPPLPGEGFPSALTGTPYIHVASHDADLGPSIKVRSSPNVISSFMNFRKTLPPETLSGPL